MPTPVLLPALSPTMEEGTLSRWNVKEGDKVAYGDVIAEIETDKATLEIEAAGDGVIGKILVPAGTRNVKINTAIAMLIAAGESGAGVASARRNGRARAKARETGAAPEAVRSGEEMPPPPAPAVRILASPLAKRLAAQAKIDLAVLKGTGPKGRIVRRDVEQAKDGGVALAAEAVPATGHAKGMEARLYPPESYLAVKLDDMRRTIARRLHQSFNHDVPHFPLNIDCELTNLLAARASINDASLKGGDGSLKLSVNDFVIKASAMALKAVPGANASYTDDAILLHRHADIGVAVAIDGGLITPIVWKADTKGLKQISSEVKDMAGRARQKKLKPEDYQGGTFSVSNLGMFGITSFASIVNQPQGAILSVGAAGDRVVVREGQVAIRTMMTVTLTCDHRVVDGAVGAAFLAAFKAFVEEPAAMLL